MQVQFLFSGVYAHENLTQNCYILKEIYSSTAQRQIKMISKEKNISDFFQIHLHSQLPPCTHHHCQGQRGPTELDTPYFQCHSAQ